jgi:hypothetical protein
MSDLSVFPCRHADAAMRRRKVRRRALISMPIALPQLRWQIIGRPTAGVVLGALIIRRQKLSGGALIGRSSKGLGRRSVQCSRASADAPTWPERTTSSAEARDRSCRPVVHGPVYS